jgi:hypothetical protein
MVGFSLLASAGPASAQADPGFGICHATEAEGNPYVYIEPDDASYASHLAHFGVEGGDRFATEEEFEAGECFADEEPTATDVPATATDVPATATDVPVEPTATTAPGEPTATTAPGQPEPTDVPVQTLPETGVTPSDSSRNAALVISVLAAVLLLGTATVVGSRSRR